MTDFAKTLINVMQELPEEEAKDFAFTPNYIKFYYPDLYAQHLEYYIEDKQKANANFEAPEKNSPKYKKFDYKAGQNLWALCRELYEYRSIEVDWMYNETMFLCNKLFPEGVYFVEKEYGESTIPDRNSIFNGVRYWADKLLLQIYPNIERLLTHLIVDEKVTSNVIRGKINWNYTIINTIKEGGGNPVKFTCISPKVRFDTPENFLLLISIYWLYHDVRWLLSLDFSRKYSAEQKNLLQRVLKTSEKILERTPLKEISEECLSLSKLNKRPNLHKEIIRLIKDSNKRIARNASASRYRSLLKWINDYVSWNISRAASSLDFGMDRKEDIDKMFELWILFGMADYFHKYHHARVVPISQNKGKKPPILKGFSLSMFGRTIDLHWEKRFPQQTEPNHIVEPDFVFQVNDSYVPIIMDAKNWQQKSMADIKRILVYYLVELDRLRPSHAIGIVPIFKQNKSGSSNYNQILVGSQYPPAYPEQKKTHWKVKVTNFIPKLGNEYEEKRKEVYAQIYETLKKSIIPVPEITS